MGPPPFLNSSDVAGTRQMLCSCSNAGRKSAITPVPLKVGSAGLLAEKDLTKGSKGGLPMNTFGRRPNFAVSVM